MIEFKNDKARETYPEIDDKLKDAIYECSGWCEERLLPLVITRAVDDMIPNISKTDIHKQKRAVDISVKGWTTEDVDEFVHDFNHLFAEKIGAFSITDGKPRFAVAHVGTANHIHLQVRR